MRKTHFQHNLQQRISDSEFSCFIAQRRSGTSTFFSMFCCEQDAEKSVLYITGSIRDAKKAAHNIDYMRSHIGARELPTLKFVPEKKALLSLPVDGRDIIIYDAIDSTHLGRIWFDTMIPAREHVTIEHTIVAITPHFSPATTARLPAWIGELENCIHYEVVLTGNQEEHFCLLSPPNEHPNSLPGQYEWTSASTHHKIRVNVLSVEYLVGHDDNANDQQATTYITNIMMKMWRRVTAGNNGVLIAPNIADELGIEQDVILHAQITSNDCYYNKIEPLWLSLEQFQDELLPAYVDEAAPQTQ